MQTQPRPITFSPGAKIITIAIIIALSILLLRSVTHILAPFIAAAITAYLFNPLVSWAQRRSGVARWVWIIVLYLLAFALLYGLFIWLWPRLLGQYQDFVAWLPAMAAEIGQYFGRHQAIVLPGNIVIDLEPLEAQIIATLTDFGRNASGNVPRLVFTALEGLIFLLVYLIITFYLLHQSAELRDWASRLIPAAYRAEIGGLGRQIDRVLAAFIRGQLLLIIIMSVLLYIPLSILQVPYALIIAILSGVLELIPILGPWAAAGIAMTLALFQGDVPFGLGNGALAVLLGLIYFVLRQIEDHFIIPNVMGSLVRLHPGVVIFAVLAGGALAGPFGLFIAIPVAAVLRILLLYIYQKLIDQPDAPLPSAASNEQPVAETADTGRSAATRSQEQTADAQP